jgi:hypothetical protein
MPRELQSLSFRFTGKAETLGLRRREVAVPPPAETGKISVLEQADSPDLSAISTLNSRADEIAQEIQGEISKQFPFTTVLAEISFTKGSLLVAGTVMVFSWAGEIALESAKNEVAEIIRVNVKRVITRVCSALQVFGPIGLDVVPHVVAGARRDGALHEPTTREASGPAVEPATPPPSEGPGPPRLRNGYLIVLLVLTSTILLIQLLGLASQYISISVKPRRVPSAGYFGAASSDGHQPLGVCSCGRPAGENRIDEIWAKAAQSISQ